MSISLKWKVKGIFTFGSIKCIVIIITKRSNGKYPLPFHFRDKLNLKGFFFSRYEKLQMSRSAKVETGGVNCFHHFCYIVLCSRLSSTIHNIDSSEGTSLRNLQNRNKRELKRKREKKKGGGGVSNFITVLREWP